MKSHVLHYIQTFDLVDRNVSLFWRCDAENYEHALEQLKDEVEGNQSEKLIFVELYK